MIPDQSTSLVYLNTIQNQVYTTHKLHKMHQLYTTQLKSGKLDQVTFDRLCKIHFENLVKLSKYISISGKKHSTLCEYANTSSCNCWCKSKYHGIKLVKEII